MANEFRCPYCDRSCTSQSGLTLHAKKCQNRSGTEMEMEDYDDNPQDNRDVDPRGPAPTTESPRPSRPQSSTKPKSESAFNVGAFLIFGDHIPLLLDLNFASALANHILKHGSENRAILAFGHQLAKASGEDE